jgi:acetyl-CoA C-acetyltransferase
MVFKNVVIVGGKRTPVGCIGGSLKQVPSPLLLSSIIKPGLGSTPVSLVSSAIFSCALPYNIGINPAKQALALSGIENVPAYTVNNGHLGGLKSAVLASQDIETNRSVVLCGGFDSSSLAPHTLKGRKGWDSDEKILDELCTAYYTSTNLHYGLAIEQLVTEYGVHRADQETYTTRAFDRRQVCLRTDYFDKEIWKLNILNSDELCIYPHNLVLGPLFYSVGTITSYTTALPSDGAVVIQLAHIDIVRKFDIDYLGYILGYIHIRKHPILFPDILYNGIKKLLESVGLNKSSIGLWEINDYFSVIPCIISKVLDINFNIINLSGGNLAVGDTLGASGAKSLLSCIMNMQHRFIEYGVVISTNCDGEILALALKSNLSQIPNKAN